MVNFEEYRKKLLNKVVEIDGEKAIVKGLGKSAFKMAQKAPAGFTTKKELSCFFVSYDSMTPEFEKQIMSFLPPKKETQKKDEELFNLLS